MSRVLTLTSGMVYTLRGIWLKQDAEMQDMATLENGKVKTDRLLKDLKYTTNRL